MSNLSLVETAGKVLSTYGSERVGRRGFIKGVAAGGAAGAATVLERVAQAHEEVLKPPVQYTRDGRLATILPFGKNDLSKAYIVTFTDGIEAFNGNSDLGIEGPAGNAWGGKGKIIIGTRNIGTNIGLRALGCNGGLFLDVIPDTEGRDFEEILAEEMARVPALERINYNQLGILLTKDTWQRGATPDLFVWSIDLGIRPPAGRCDVGMPAAQAAAAPAPEQIPAQPPGQPPAQPEVHAAEVCPTTWEWPGIFRASGVPSVGVTNIDIARPERGFNWRDFPSGMRAFFAEPGGLLVDRNKIPVGDLAQWDNIVRNSNGAVNFVNPQNQQVFQSSRFEGSIPWKGYAMFSLEEGRLSIPDEDSCLIVDFFQQEPGVLGANNYLIVVKGRNGDQALGRTARWERAVGGNALYQRYDRAAFVSADQLNQLSVESHRISRRTTVVGLDLNTRAMMVAQQDRGSATWRWIVANYTGV